MNNNELILFLKENSDDKYKDFSQSLVPGAAYMYGVRIPVMRNLAKKIAKEDWKTYLEQAKDDSFEEILLQGLVIGTAKMDINERLEYFEKFIPKICDWSINDVCCATYKSFQKNREVVWDFLMKYVEADGEFQQRVVAIMLMDHFLVDEYIDKVFEVYDRLTHPGYYRMMGVAWGVATAYAKFPQKTYEYLLNNKLDDVTYNKAIQKMIESNRVSDEDKAKLRLMKRK